MGWGKTSFIGSGGKEYDIIIMRPPIDHVDAILDSGCREMVVKDWDDVFEGLEQILHLPKAPDIFSMDSISLLQDVGLDDVYEGHLLTKGPAGSAAYKAREQFGPDRSEYGVNMWRLAQWVRRAVSAAEFDLIITAHSFWYEPKDSDDAYIAPWIQGKGMPQRICGMMNIVGYGTIEERTVRGHQRNQRVINWDKGVDFYAKNQFKKNGVSVYPEGKVVNPTLPEVWATLNQGRPVTRGRRRPTTRPVRKTGGRPSKRGS